MEQRQRTGAAVVNLKNAIRDRVKARYKDSPKEEKSEGGGVQKVRDALAALETALTECLPDYKPKK